MYNMPLLQAKPPPNQRRTVTLSVHRRQVQRERDGLGQMAPSSLPPPGERQTGTLPPPPRR